MKLQLCFPMMVTRVDCVFLMYPRQGTYLAVLWRGGLAVPGVTRLQAAIAPSLAVQGAAPSWLPGQAAVCGAFEPFPSFDAG